MKPAEIFKDQLLSSLDMEFLKTFIAIAEVGSFSKAAKQVFRTPSAVSMQIKKLEDTLGASLFVRDARSVRLTEDGEMLLGYAKQILALNNEVLARFLEPEMTGTVRLGSPDDYGSRLLPVILRKFACTHPQVTVDVVIDTTERLIERMEEREVDVILLTASPDQPMHKDEIVALEEPLVWVGLKGGHAHLQDPLPIAMWEAGCVWRALAIRSLQGMNRSYRSAYMTSSTVAQRAAIQSDLAVAVAPRSFIDEPIVRLTETEGFQDLGVYQIRLRARPDLDKVAQAVREHVIASFEAFKVGELECL
ncbi:LysR family transcriptional regulator [Sneathiella aquimaris]|uniref:LysR family transcriptional regulator n=1 Tax=Sneathiella aquimaris TaxID=2599305 RepID=UPI00146D8C20|nr:LysR substrate-binding domain-containing protein [Sneathiella aquimaris]